MPDLYRIERKRQEGWRMPENTVYVGRPTRWGNPWKVGLKGCGCRSAGECGHNSFRCANAQEACEAYKMRLDAMPPARRKEFLAPLRGKHLACWCPQGTPCHADILLEAANKEEES